MKKNIFATMILLCVVTSVFAHGGRYRVAKEIYDHPSILTEPWFWIVGVICLVLVGIYYMVKDKDK